MEYKLLVLDMDGTLLNDDLEISRDDKKAIKSLQAKGIKVALASGRPAKAMEKYARELDLDLPLISANGAIVKSIAGDKVYFESLLPDNIKRELLIYAEKNNIGISVYTKEKIITSSQKMAEGHRTHENIEPEMVTQLEQVKETAVKILFRTVDQLLLNKIVTYLANRYKDLLYVTQSEEEFIEIMNQDVSKGNALEALLESLALKPQQVVAVGNNHNDLSMFSVAGLSVATANAPQKIKEQADYITKDNQNSGVAHVIEKLLL